MPVKKALDAFALTDEMPEGCSFSMGGESDSVNYMTDEMIQWMALALPFVYLVMVAQFQSLLSPFIVLFTVPLAFTGGLLGLLLTGQQLTMISMMGFIVLMGTVVNNGIVFVDYANQLRMGGMERRAALVATGKTRMRPILMTTLTTVLAMLQMVFSNDMASQLMSGMAIVIICGLSYATLMTCISCYPVRYPVQEAAAQRGYRQRRGPGRHPGRRRRVHCRPVLCGTASAGGIRLTARITKAPRISTGSAGRFLVL